METIRYVAANMRAIDYREISATSWADNRRDLALDVAERYSRYTDTMYVAGIDKPTAVIGWIPVWPGMWSVSMFATDNYHLISKDLTKFACRDIIPALGRGGAHRIECRSHADHTQAHAWLEFLGMSKEATLPGYGKNGEDFFVFSYVRSSDGPMEWVKRGVIQNVCIRRG